MIGHNFWFLWLTIRLRISVVLLGYLLYVNWVTCKLLDILVFPKLYFVKTIAILSIIYNADYDLIF